MAKTVAAMVLAFGFLVPNAMGQTDYPAKPVKLLVGFPAGGGTDVFVTDRRNGAIDVRRNGATNSS